MTIPIRPGPWSFLGSLGQGVGETLKAKAEFEKQDRMEASQMLKFLFDAASGPDKTFKAEILTSPTTQKLMERAGVGKLLASNLMAQPGEQVAAGQSAALEHILPGVVAPNSTDTVGQEELAQGRIPTQASRAKIAEETGRATVRSGVLAGKDAAGKPDAAARRVAEVPSPELAVAQEEAPKDTFYNTVAQRSVDASMTQLKVTDLNEANIGSVSEAAWASAQTDAKARGYTLNEQMTKPYVDAAIQTRLREQEERSIKALRAGQDTNRYKLDFYQRQQQRVNDAIKSLNVPDGTQRALASSVEKLAQSSKPPRTVEQVLADPNVSPFQKEAYVTYQIYKRQLASLTTEGQGYRDNIGQLLAGQIGTPDPGAPPASSERREGRGAAFNSPSAPDALGNQEKAKKLARYKELVAEELKKPAAQRRPQADLVAQAEQEGTQGFMSNFGRDNTPAPVVGPETDPRKMKPQPTDSPSRRSAAR